MKGVIVNCLAEMVTQRFGKEKWEAALEKAGLNRTTAFLGTKDYDDALVLKLVNSVCNVLGISLQQAADAFGEYWVCNFAPKVYPIYYKGVNSAKEFLLKMDHVHEMATKSLPGASPPRFGYQWKDDKTLIMTYNSKRGLIDIMIGLIKGVGKYYKENLKVTKLGPDKVEIKFP
jgi:hypothetical protein